MLSLTALNTLVDVAGFHRPWTMHPFSIRGVGELWLHGTPRFLFGQLFYLQGVGDRAAVPRAEVYAHHALLRRGDRGRAFLRIMRGFELTAAKERFFLDGLAQRRYPAQVVWGRDDPALGQARREAVMRALGRRERDPARGQALPPGGPLSRGRGGRRRDRRRLAAARPARGSGISTASKSRGAIVGSKTSRASSSTLPTW